MGDSSQFRKSFEFVDEELINKSAESSESSKYDESESSEEEET